ncbi:MAG: hypothetical protein NUV76_00600 [Candidatus Kuenenia sp.]|nr:hypothetical protein [Candidatus Kuenenia sp.]
MAKIKQEVEKISCNAVGPGVERRDKKINGVSIKAVDCNNRFKRDGLIAVPLKMFC